MKNIHSVLCLAIYIMAATFPASAIAGERSKGQFFEPSRLTQAKWMFRFPSQDFSTPLLNSQTQNTLSLFTGADGDVANPAQPKLVYPILGAVAGGGLGIVVGGAGALAAVEAIGCEEEDCELEWLFWGAVAGEALLLPLGTHLGNKRQGNFLLDWVVSSAIAFGGMALTFEKGSAAIFVATPILQVVSTVAVERLFGGR